MNTMYSSSPVKHTKYTTLSKNSSSSVKHTKYTTLSKKGELPQRDTEWGGEVKIHKVRGINTLFRYSMFCFLSIYLMPW